MSDQVDAIPIAVRAYAVRMGPGADAEGDTKRKRADPAWRPKTVVVFDCETEIDAGQQLKFGSWRYYDVAWDDFGVPTLACLEEGLIYDDDLPDRDSPGYAVLIEYQRAHRPDVDRKRRDAATHLRLFSRSTFAEEVLFRVGFEQQGLIVGFNLPFDLSRLAYKQAGPARNPDPERGSDSYEGGFSLPIMRSRRKTGGWYDNSKYRPRLAVKTIDSKRHLIGFRWPAKSEERPEQVSDEEPRRFHGHFLDLRTLAFALTNTSYRLAGACVDFEVEHPKQEAERHGVITPEYVDYNRADVRATAELFAKLISEYHRHPIALEPTKAFSPASIGKAYLRAMGIQPPLARQPDFPTDVLGYAMSAYYGGRTECRVRRISVPVAYCDFLSMYPTVNSLLDLWDMVTCERIHVQDATADVQRFLDQITLDRCFDPTTWSHLRVLAQVEPDGDVLPTRAEYASNQQWQIGINPLTSKWPLWYALPDLVAAKLLHPNHKSPRILRALRLVPEGRQSPLRPVRLRGEVTVDPASTDFFRRVIEERKSLDRRDLEAAESERLDEFLKVLANSTSYGIYAEMIRHELADKRTVDVTVQRIDGSSFHTPVRTPEDPGEWFFAPMAALITSAARLMLALAEQSVTDAGGTYAFCDTDSIAIITHPNGGPIHIDDTPDHPIPALSWEQVDAIRDTFRDLNPYEDTAVEGSVLELEDENSVDGERTELLCYAISAKRYALYRTDKSGAVLLRRSRNQTYEKWSEHGLGHLSNPTSINTEDRDWIRDAWLAILAGENKQPEWANQPVVSQTTISSPHLLNPFKDYNTDSRLADQVKAFNFLLSTQVAPLAHPQDVDPARFHLIAPYERDPTQWITLPWRDRYTKRHHPITPQTTIPTR